MGTAIVLISLLLPASMQGAKALEKANAKIQQKEERRLDRMMHPDRPRYRMGEVFKYPKYK